MQVVPTLRTLHTCRYDGSWSCGKCGATHPVDQRCPLGVNPPCRSVDVWLPLVAAGAALLSCVHLPPPVQIAACSSAPQPQQGLACRRADPFPGLPHTPDLAMVPQTLLSPLAHLVVSPLTLPTSSIHPGRRSYLIGKCQTGVGCGVAHPPIELDSDAFPADLPWQEVAVVPPGALQGRSAAQWCALLRRHAAAAPAPGITSQLGHLVHCSGGVDAANEQPAPAASCVDRVVQRRPTRAPKGWWQPQLLQTGWRCSSRRSAEPGLRSGLRPTWRLQRRRCYKASRGTRRGKPRSSAAKSYGEMGGGVGWE